MTNGLLSSSLSGLQCRRLYKTFAVENQRRNKLTDSSIYMQNFKAHVIHPLTNCVSPKYANIKSIIDYQIHGGQFIHKFNTDVFTNLQNILPHFNF